MSVMVTLGTLAVLAAGGLCAVTIIHRWRGNREFRQKQARLHALGCATQLPMICRTCERELRQMGAGFFYHADRKHYPHRALPV